MRIAIVGWLGTCDDYFTTIDTVKDVVTTLHDNMPEGLDIILYSMTNSLGPTVIKESENRNITIHDAREFYVDMRAESPKVRDISEHLDLVYAFGSKAVDVYDLDDCGVEVVYFNVEMKW